MEKLMKEENEWYRIISAGVKEGQADCIRINKVAAAVVRTVYGNSNGFEVKVAMHQGSELRPLLYVIVTEALSREFRVALPWELLNADDLL